MVNWEQIEQVNAKMKPTDVKGRPYVEVNERIKGFRKLYPEGFIETEILSNENGMCVMQTKVGYYTEAGEKRILGTGLAYEKESSSYINKTSYIENCETSSCGRALGMCGFGIDTAIASAEEVQNAINNQNPKDTKKATAKQVELIKSKFTGGNIEEWLQRTYGISKVEDLSLAQADELVKKIGGKK